MQIVIVGHEDLVYRGIGAAISVVQNDTVVWNPKVKNAMDMFAELKPDILMCVPEDMNEHNLAYALRQYDHTKCLVYEEQSVTCFSHSATFRETLDTTVIVGPAANVAQYDNAKADPDQESDILYISNQPITPEIMEILRCCASTPYKMKIVGQYPVPLMSFLGQTNVIAESTLMASTKIVIDIDNNIKWDCAFNGVFCLSNVPHDNFAIYEEGNIVEQIDHFITQEKHRKSFIKKTRKLALENTYFNIVEEIFTKLACPTLTRTAAKINEKIRNTSK
jgi:hypothetical protein